MVIGAGLVIVMGAAVGTVAWLMTPRTALAAFSNEPDSTRRFVDSFDRVNPAGMRAEVSTKCVKDMASLFCFASNADGPFRHFMANRTATTKFIQRYRGKLGTLALYDLVLRDRKSGDVTEYVLSFLLGADGRIDRVTTG